MATSTRTPIVRTGLAVAATSVLLGLAPAGTAQAAVTTDSVTASFVKLGAGLDGVVPFQDARRPAGSIVLALPDGTELETYCLEFDKPTAKGGTYQNVSWAAAPKREAVAKAAFLAANHASIGTAFDSANYENAATQVAIWELTNPGKVDADKIGNKDFAKRVKQLTSGAKAAPEPATAITLTPGKATVGEGTSQYTRVTATVHTATGAPAAGVEVRFDVAGDVRAATTDANGVAYTEVAQGSAEQTVSMAVMSNVPAGAVFVPSDTSKQAVVSGTGFQAYREASMVVSAGNVMPTPTPIPTTESTPTPEATPTPEPTTPPTPTETTTPVPTPTPEPETPVETTTETPDDEPKDEPKDKSDDKPKDPKPEPKPDPKPKPEQPTVSIPDELPKTGAGWAGLIGGALGLGGAGFAGLRHFRRRF